MFSHRFRLGKHGFNRCFTRSVPGTGSSIWGPSQASWHSSCGPDVVDGGSEGRPDGARGKGPRETERDQVYMPRDSGPISPVRPNSVWVREPWSFLPFGAAVYGRHYLDRPRVGLNDLFVCTFHFIGPTFFSYVILNASRRAALRHPARCKIRPRRVALPRWPLSVDAGYFCTWVTGEYTRTQTSTVCISRYT